MIKNNTTPSNYTVDYIFWISLLLFTNPGGIQQALNIYDIFGSQLNFNDLLYPIMLLCFLFVNKSNMHISKLTKSISIALIVFSLYYVFVYALIIPKYKYTNANLLFNLIKIRLSIYNISFFFFTLVFWKRSWKIFLKLYIFTSIFILLVIFIQVTFIQIKILPIELVNRGFISLQRQHLISYGIMPLLTVIAAIILVFKFKSKYNLWIIIGFILMNIAWIISITRRHILGTIIYFIIAIILFAVIKKNLSLKIFSRLIRIVFSFALLILLLWKVFPDYLEAGFRAIDDTIYLIRYGENTAGVYDERLNIYGRYSIIKEFEENPLFGTGYRHSWYTMAGDRAGFEASDYPFQAALAMFGIIGCFFFLPIYLSLIKMLYQDILSNRNIINKNNIQQMIVLVFVLYFVYDILQYINWFSPVSIAINTYYYMYLGMYVGAREIFYLSKINI